MKSEPGFAFFCALIFALYQTLSEGKSTQKLAVQQVVLIHLFFGMIKVLLPVAGHVRA